MAKSKVRFLIHPDTAYLNALDKYYRVTGEISAMSVTKARALKRTGAVVCFNPVIGAHGIMTKEDLIHYAGYHDKAIDKPYNRY